MKKVCSVLLILSLIFCLCACAAEPAEPEATPAPTEPPVAAETPAAQMANPMIPCVSLDELNSRIGSELCHPAVMGVTNDEFYVITTQPEIGEYRFEVNGVPYIFRASKSVDDISGYYLNDGTAFSKVTGKDLAFASAPDAMLARWFVGDMQYVLAIEDSGKMSEDTFKGIVNEMQFLTNYNFNTGGDLEELAGEYQDSWSQRAVATATAYANGLDITVSWSSSAFERTEWNMLCNYDSEGRLVYSNGSASDIKTAADGTETYTLHRFPAEGHFDLVNGKLCWTGAGEERCRLCVFEKMP